MAVYQVQRGLAIAVGERQLAFHRMLDEKTVQFEDVRSGSFRTLKLADLQNGVSSGKYMVVGSHQATDDWVAEVETQSGTAAVVSRLDEKKQKEWQRRQSYVLAMRRRGVTIGNRAQVNKHLYAVANQLDDQAPPSDSTVLRWLKSYVESGKSQTSLIPRTAFRKSVKRTDQAMVDAVWRLVKKHYLRREGSSLAEVWRRLEAQHAKARISSKLISKSTLYRIVATLPAYERDRVRIGAAAANAKWRHSTGGIYATRPLERVEMDHTELDLYVIDEHRGIPLGKPVITVLIDSFSGYILAIYLSFEGETLSRVSRSIKLALSPKLDLTSSIPTQNEWITAGLWECLVVDNALAFHSPQLKNITLALGCELEFCPVRKPWFKPTVERVIAEFGRILPMQGKTSKLRGLIDPYDPVAGACITFGDLVECLTLWVVDVYPFSIPERSLERPIDRFMGGLESAPAPVVCTGLDSLEIITGLGKETTVRQGGIEFMYLPYRSPELGELVKRQRTPNFKAMMKYDPNDLGRVWVQDPTEKTWLAIPCMYPDYAAGLSRRQHQFVRKTTKEDLRSKGAYEALMRAQTALRERFDDAALRGRKIREHKKLAVLSGVSSLKQAEQKTSVPILLPEQIIVDEKLAIETREIPAFKAVSLHNPDGWETRR